MNFDDYAKTWDTEKRIKRAKLIADEIRNDIPLKNDLSAMEFGCGTGLISFNLYDKLGKITLIDSSKAMIDIVNDKMIKYKVDHMSSLHIDLSEEEFPSGRFDLIYNSMVLHHIHNTDAIINNFYRLLNKDGYLCIIDLDKEDGSFHGNYPDFDGHNGFDQENLKSVLIGAGFHDIKSHTFFYDQKEVDGKIINYSLFIMKARK